MSDAPLYDIRVSVRTQYLESQSDPEQQRFVFAYHITISNRGVRSAQLLRRHWIILDGDGGQEEVEGEGVIGQQPVIAPGRSYEYTSGCVLKTDCGSMRGSYQMRAEDGHLFEAPIEAFALRIPGVLH